MRALVRQKDREAALQREEKGHGVHGDGRGQRVAGIGQHHPRLHAICERAVIAGGEKLYPFETVGVARQQRRHLGGVDEIGADQRVGRSGLARQRLGIVDDDELDPGDRAEPRDELGPGMACPKQDAHLYLPVLGK
jgi:hypothetical protein